MSFRVWRQQLALMLPLALVALPASAQEYRETQHVLFVGNSYIYYNNLPEMVEAISVELSGPQVHAEAHTRGGYTLQAHLDDGNVAKIVKQGNPEGGAWSAVILQEQSSLGTRGRSGVLSPPDEFFGAVMSWDALVDSVGSDLYLYMTWAKEWIPDQTAGLAGAYIDAGEMADASVAPVGLAWARVRDERPELDLYRPDGSHPTALGSYLAACVIYSQLTGQPSEGAPATIRGSNWRSTSGPSAAASDATSSSDVVLVSLDAEVASYLQRIAWDVVESTE